MNSDIFRSMSYGVYVVSTMDKGRPTGCIANSIMQITSSPATVAVSMNHDNYTNGCIRESGMFAFSILSETSDPGLIGTFGFRSGKEADKFAQTDYEMAEGMPVIKDSCGYVVCRVIDAMETSTHTVFLGEVIEGDVYGGAADAMTYAYYHKVIKGKSPKNAPTYLPEKEETAQAEPEKKNSRKWVCQICGYVAEGPFPGGGRTAEREELPVDYICPVCGQGADQFVPAEK